LVACLWPFAQEKTKYASSSDLVALSLGTLVFTRSHLADEVLKSSKRQRQLQKERSTMHAEGTDKKLVVVSMLNGECERTRNGEQRGKGEEGSDRGLFG